MAIQTVPIVDNLPALGRERIHDPVHVLVRQVHHRHESGRAGLVHAEVIALHEREFGDIGPAVNHLYYGVLK